MLATSSRFGYIVLPLILWLLPHLTDGSLQLTIPFWRSGRPALLPVLTFTLPRSALSAAKAD